MDTRVDYNSMDSAAGFAADYGVEAIYVQDVLPERVWQTMSAFANTKGGTILLGVKRTLDYTYEATGLQDPEGIMQELWKGICSKERISCFSILMEDISLTSIDGKSVVVIQVPEADLSEKPVYINGNMATGTYCRDGIANRQCKWSEVCDMIQYYSGPMGSDRRVIKQMGLDAIDPDSLSGYRRAYAGIHPVLSGVPVDTMTDTDFMLCLGIAGKGNDGALHPTRGGLLMFGRGTDIRRAFRDCRLVFHDGRNGSAGSMNSSSGEWSGNIYSFFIRTYKALAGSVLAMTCISCVNDTDVLTAVREGLVNCLVHADYSASCDISVSYDGNEMVFSNSGTLKTDMEAALAGGFTCPRNSGLMRFFEGIGLADRAGSGIPMIYRTWSARHWEAPVLQADSDRTTLALKCDTT